MGSIVMGLGIRKTREEWAQVHGQALEMPRKRQRTKVGSPTQSSFLLAIKSLQLNSYKTLLLICFHSSYLSWYPNSWVTPPHASLCWHSVGSGPPYPKEKQSKTPLGAESQCMIDFPYTYSSLYKCQWSCFIKWGLEGPAEWHSS